MISFSQVVADLNDSVADGSITTNKLNEQILKYLRPEILKQPVAPKYTYVKSSIELNVTVEGKFLVYQWLKNSEIISGETNSNLILQNLNSVSHDGNYSLVVSNDFGSVESSPVQILVNHNDYRGVDISLMDFQGQNLFEALFDSTTIFSNGD